MGQSRKKKRAKQSRSSHTTKASSRDRLVQAGFIVLVLLLIGGGALLLASNQQPPVPADFVPEVTGAPRVAVAPEVIDFGDVTLDVEVEAVFRIRNVGDEVLRILDYEPPVELVEGC